MNTDVAAYWTLINARIKELGTTQENVCKQIGMKYQTMRSMVTKGIFPRLPYAAAIAETLKLDLDYTWTQKINSAEEQFYRDYSQYTDLLETLKRLSAENVRAVTVMAKTLAG